jgi:rhodanese-related sulfurtransferase
MNLCNIYRIGEVMKELSAQEAYEIIESNPDSIYLDVRSVQEFEAGHPEKSINIPIMHFAPGVGMTPNEEFPAVVEANLPKNAKLVVGCKTGMRSARACDLLSQMGYTDVSNVRGGFMGMTDNFGRLIEPGWSTLNLPASTESLDGARYETLAAKAKK